VPTTLGCEARPPPSCPLQIFFFYYCFSPRHRQRFHLPLVSLPFLAAVLLHFVSLTAHPTGQFSNLPLIPYHIPRRPACQPSRTTLILPPPRPLRINLNEPPLCTIPSSFPAREHGKVYGETPPSFLFNPPPPPPPPCNKWSTGRFSFPPQCTLGIYNDSLPKSHGNLIKSNGSIC